MSTSSPVQASSTDRHPAFRVPGLAERAGRAFTPQACLRGYALFTKDKVAVAHLDDARADVVVRGQKAREVRVEVEGGALSLACTCAPSSLPFAPCRHAWAALLELDRRAAFPPLRSTRGLLALRGLDRGASAASADVAVAAEPSKPRRAPRAKPASKRGSAAPRPAGGAAKTKRRASRA